MENTGMNGHQRQREQSARMIETALFALLEEKEWKAISVSEIVTTADVARRTFYRLYRGKEEVLHQYFVRLCREYTGSCRTLKQYDFGQIASDYFRFWHGHKEELLLLYQRGMKDMLFYEIGCAAREVVESRVEETGRKNHGAIACFSDYSSGGFLMLLYRWLEEGMEGTPEDYAAKVCAALMKFIRPVSEEMPENK